ncbi:hypothetical protein G6F66_015175 [Rhizopus arrhizus]|nr:hypothetical protein G6F66_015175 [Rhizopus arrhizus]
MPDTPSISSNFTGPWKPRRSAASAQCSASASSAGRCNRSCNASRVQICEPVPTNPPSISAGWRSHMVWNTAMAPSMAGSRPATGSARPCATSRR